MPPHGAYVSPEAHATTLGHECIHWTRHPTRLNRDFGRKRWGDEGYAREELVAELGSAYLAADLGIAIEPREDHAAYISSWIEVLHNDKRAIFQAASFAEKAVAFLHRLQPGAVAPESEEIDAQQIAAWHESARPGPSPGNTTHRIQYDVNSIALPLGGLHSGLS